VPDSKGFGSTILVDAARGSSKSVVMDFTAEGLNYWLKIPLRAIESANKANGAETVMIRNVGGTA
jgi:hypothetical protein